MKNTKFEVLMKEMDSIAAKVQLFPDGVQDVAFRTLVDALLEGEYKVPSTVESNPSLDMLVQLSDEKIDSSEEIGKDLEQEVKQIYGRIKYRRLNDMEFCAFVAYYFTQRVHESQKVNGINEAHVRDIASHVGREGPKNPKSSLHNANHHGKLLERVGKGVFALSEKGEEFVEGILGKEVPL